MTLIAEDLLLLLLDDESGKPQTNQLQVALGGAVLVELALVEAVVVEERSSMWHAARVRVAPAAETDDPVLRDALALVAEKDRSAQELVERLGRGLAEKLGTRLVDRGLLERREDKLLGIIPRTRWPARDCPAGRHRGRAAAGCRRSRSPRAGRSWGPGPPRAAVARRAASRSDGSSPWA